jgi:hypothetical protein
MPSFHRFGLPDYEFVKPGLGRSDNLVIQRPYKRIERRIMKGLEDPVSVLDPQVLQHGEGFLSLSMIGRNGIMISGTVACSSSGADFGFVTSAITKRDSPASSLTVSVKSFVSGLSKLKTIGR